VKPNKGCISSAFGVDLINGGGVWVPKLLLRNYTKLGITNTEMILLIHLLGNISTGSTHLKTGEIADCMGVTPDKVSSLLISLEEKGVLLKDSNASFMYDNIPLQSLRFDRLFDRLLEIWGCEKAKVYEKDQLSEEPFKKMGGASRVVGNLYRCFEKEFGRPLSPIESTQIMEWYYGDKYSCELIIEALKRAVLRGVLNFKYIDSILRGWSKNNIKTVKAVLAYEEAFANSKNVKGKIPSDVEAADLDKKYDDVYLT
jgi:DNA replication protein